MSAASARFFSSSVPERLSRYGTRIGRRKRGEGRTWRAEAPRISSRQIPPPFPAPLRPAPSHQQQNYTALLGLFIPPKGGLSALGEEMGERTDLGR